MLGKTNNADIEFAYWKEFLFPEFSDLKQQLRAAPQIFCVEFFRS